MSGMKRTSLKLPQDRLDRIAAAKEVLRSRETEGIDTSRAIDAGLEALIALETVGELYRERARELMEEARGVVKEFNEAQDVYEVVVRYETRIVPKSK